MIVPARHFPPSRELSRRAAQRAMLFALLLCSLLWSAGAWAAPDPAELLAAGRADDALRLLTPEVDGKNATALNYLCRVYFQLEDWDNAVQNCQQAAALEPRNAIFELWLGRSYGEKADASNLLAAYPLARKTAAAFIDAHSLDRGNIAIARDLAEYYSAAPAFLGGGSSKTLALAAEMAPRHPSDAAWMRGEAASCSGHWEEAEREYREAIRLDHGSASTILEFAHYFKGRKQWDRVQETVEHALHAEDIRPADRYDAAELLLKSNRDLDEAARQMRAYIASGHTEESAPLFRAHYLLGEILRKIGDTRQAVAEYRAALELAGSYRPALDALRRHAKH